MNFMTIGDVASFKTAENSIRQAHRLSTTKNCDLIYLLDRGRVVEQRTYDELISTSPRFRNWAGQTKMGD